MKPYLKKHLNVGRKNNILIEVYCKDGRFKNGVEGYQYNMVYTAEPQSNGAMLVHIEYNDPKTGDYYFNPKDFKRHFMIGGYEQADILQQSLLKEWEALEKKHKKLGISK